MRHGAVSVVGCLLVWCAGAGAREVGEITTTSGGCKSCAPRAFFLLAGPVVAEKRYAPWVFSGVAVAHALQAAGSEADVVLLLAARGPARAGHSRETPTRITDLEEQALRAARMRWRYVDAPGPGVPGYNLGHYKVHAWQHVEYDTIQLLDVDCLPLVNMDVLFDFPLLLQKEVVACPGRVSPFNAGWIVLRPSLDRFKGLVQLLGAHATRNSKDLVAPWGHELEGWYDCIDKERKAGWDFFDFSGSQGELYSYFRFDAHSLAMLSHTPNRPLTIRLYGGESELQPAKELFEAVFPCTFGTAKRGATLNRAYLHYTSRPKPWTTFQPNNTHFKPWYDALERSPLHAEILDTLFPGSSRRRRSPGQPAAGEQQPGNRINTRSAA